MASRLDVTVVNALEELERLAELVEGFLDDNGLPRSLSYPINLCLDELITNTVSYGYPDTGSHEIRVSLEHGGETSGPAWVRITVTDDGKPFDPFHDAPKPDITLDVESRPIGGLGVYLIKKLMDEADYRREDGFNVITLVKRAPAT